MTRIAICGIRGRMGRAIMGLARESDDIRVTGGIARAGRPGADDDVRTVPLENAADVLRDTDVLIDFSSAAATDALVSNSGDALEGHAVVIGTTGLDAATQDRIDALSERTAVLTAANFSLGVNLLLALVERAAATLSADDFDIEIIEAHHRGKADAPSGTALALGAAAARGRGIAFEDARRDGRSGSGARVPGEIAHHAVRGGGIVGEHRVLFAGTREVVELRHDALDRSVFAAGALAAARWIAGRGPGRYTMQDVLGL